MKKKNGILIEFYIDCLIRVVSLILKLSNGIVLTDVA